MLPADDPHRYTLRQGRVVTRSLEAHIVDHCNLRCRQCCSLSPFLDPWTAAPEALAEDLRLAGRALAPTYLKLVGGEPLLHPRLLDCVRVAKDSGVAEVVSLTTNGILLPEMDERVWHALDHMTLSLYPKPRLSDARLAAIREMAERFEVELNVKAQDHFEDIHFGEARHDDSLTRSIFERCWLRRRCHLVRDGRFYTCTVPIHFDAFWHGDPPFARLDGFELDERPGLAEELRAYLERREPLEACRRCLGGTGELRPHRQLTAAEVRLRADGPM